MGLEGATLRLVIKDNKSHLFFTSRNPMPVLEETVTMAKKPSSDSFAL